MTRPKVGDERWLLETINHADVEALARKNGWDGGDDSVRDYAEPSDAAKHTAHPSLDAATEAARAFLATGKSSYGCAIIDHQVFEAPRIGGELIGVPPEWETQKSYEVAMDGERIEVES